MASIQNFRSAFNGFNREDVVSYIEYINNQHNAQVAQLNTQLQNTNEALTKALSQPKNTELEDRLQAAQAQCRELEVRCRELEAQLAARPAVAQPVQEKTDDELEAYRRAERAERSAKERAAQIHDQANAVLADVTVRTEEAAENMKKLIEQVSEQLQVTGEQLQGAVSALYAISPQKD